MRLIAVLSLPSASSFFSLIKSLIWLALFLYKSTVPLDLVLYCRYKGFPSGGPNKTPCLVICILAAKSLSSLGVMLSLSDWVPCNLRIVSISVLAVPKAANLSSGVAKSSPVFSVCCARSSSSAISSPF